MSLKWENKFNTTKCKQPSSLKKQSHINLQNKKEERPNCNQEKYTPENSYKTISPYELAQN